MPLLSLTVFLPLVTGLVILFIPARQTTQIKVVAIAGGILSLVGPFWLLFG